MEKRYERIVYDDGRGISFVIEAKKDMTLETQEGANGELFIKAQNNIQNIQESCSTENYANPIIIDGYKHVCGKWYNGFVIEREADRSQFVWIPVEFLERDGTLDGIHFTEKFGRRNFLNNEFSNDKFHEKLTEELEMQKESVMKHGGFYISRYNISKNEKTGKPQSVKNVMPLVNVSFFEAKEIAVSFENQSEQVRSHLPYGVEYDSVLAWFIKSESKKFSDIDKNSRVMGNQQNTKDSPRKVVKDGSRKEWCVCGIYDFCGTMDEWTQENFGSNCCVIRGDKYFTNGGFRYPAYYRFHSNFTAKYNDTGFRVTLYIK